MDFKERIKQLRTEKNISTSKLGADMDKSDSAVRSWETGRAYPDIPMVVKLASYFGCTSDYLLGISDFRNNSDFNDQEKRKNRLNEQVATITPVKTRDSFISFLTGAIEGINKIPSLSHRHSLFESLIMVFATIDTLMDFHVLEKNKNTQDFKQIIAGTNIITSYANVITNTLLFFAGISDTDPLVKENLDGSIEVLTGEDLNHHRRQCNSLRPID